MLRPPVRGFNRFVLAERRKAAKLSIAELGQRTEISGSVLSRWETGKASPRPDLLRRVADALGISTSDLVDTPENERTLSDLRSLAGYSQRALAHHLDIPFKTLERLEKGFIDLDDERAEKLAVALEVDVIELVEAYRRGAIKALQQRIEELETQPVAG